MIVALCTHNPRTEYLAETLRALRAQTLPVPEWELLVVDNASRPPLAPALDLAWHPRARVVREERLGTAHARLLALREMLARGHQTLLFVDDDNLLAPDYLTTGLTLGRQHPALGAWGGQLIPRFETPPPPWFRRYQNYLAIWEFSEPRTCAAFHRYDDLPPTAGCFLRDTVAARYLRLVEEDPRRLELGARGSVQLRGEDTDLLLTTYDCALQVGRLPSLRLTHLIPRGRLAPAYVADLLHGTILGTAMLEFLRFGKIPPRPRGGVLPNLVRLWKTSRLPAPLRRIAFAEWRAQRQAPALIATWRRNPS